MCELCLTETHWITNHINDNNIFNKKSELINKFRHLNKFSLKHVKKKIVNLGFMHVSTFVFLFLNLTNTLFCLSLDKKILYA